MTDKAEQKNKYLRKPVQQRSIDRKARLLDAAFAIFCEKGYYKTTTNEIAARAQVSIGSLYSYFKDKDTIFFEILDRYHNKFDLAKTGLLNDPKFFRRDIKNWLRLLIINLINAHEETKELNREITVLSYHNPKVAQIVEHNRAINMKATIEFFIQFKDDFKVKDPEASIKVMYDLLSATVDRIVFKENEIEPDRLIQVAIDAVYKYFFEL